MYDFDQPLTLATLPLPEKCVPKWLALLDEQKAMFEVVERDFLPIIEYIDVHYEVMITEGFDIVQNLIGGMISGGMMDIAKNILSFVTSEGGNLLTNLFDILKEIWGIMKDYPGMIAIGVLVLKQFLSWQNVAGITMAIIAGAALIKWFKKDENSAKEKGKALAKVAKEKEQVVTDKMEQTAEKYKLPVHPSWDKKEAAKVKTGDDAKKEDDAKVESYCMRLTTKTLSEVRQNLHKLHGRKLGEQRFQTFKRVCEAKSLGRAV